MEKAQGIPKGAEELKRRLVNCDALIVSSLDNGSMPGAVKNLIDWTSRFRPQPFDGKQGLLMSASPSMVGGNRGLWALRIPFEHLGARIYPDMFSLAQAHKFLVNDDIADAAHCERASKRTCKRFFHSPKPRNTTRASSAHRSNFSVSRPTLWLIASTPWAHDSGAVTSDCARPLFRRSRPAERWTQRRAKCNPFGSQFGSGSVRRLGCACRMKDNLIILL